MNVYHHHLLKTLFFALVLGFMACDKGDDSNKGTYGKGVFIINEGPFLNGTGTIDHLNRDTRESLTDIFAKENNGAVAGNIVQSMYVHRDKAYIVVNNANKIEIVDAGTFKTQGTITGLALPRYFLPVSDDRAYISEWGADGLTGAVRIIDLTNNTVLKTIALGKGPETMVLKDSKVYIALSGGYDVDNRVAIIDIATEQVQYITVGDNPKNVLFDKSGALWVLCGGKYDFVNPPATTIGGLYKIVNSNIENKYDLSNGADNLVYDADSNTLYYTNDGAIVKTSAASYAPAVFANRSFYALGFDPVSKHLFAADAKNFDSAGEIVAYDATGLIVNLFSTGIIPTDFWFE